MGEHIEIREIAELLRDKNFVRLKKERSAFNAFGVLKLKHHEIRHSNVLAWLFNPQESHGFGPAFLEQFLLRLPSCANADNTERADKIHDALQMLARGGMHVRVRRETQSEGKKRVDLQIECLFPSLGKKKDGFVIIIENKIHSTQGKHQLKDYLDHAKKRFGGIKIIPVYLTLDEDDEPADEVRDEYFHMTYGAVLEILETLSGAADSELEGSPSNLFVRDYIKTLKELLDMSTKEQEYAKEIYRNYKNVIDFIFATGDNCITDAGMQFVKQGANAEPKLEALEKGNACFFPFTDSVLKDTNGGDAKDWRGGAACGYFFGLYDKNEDEPDGLKGLLTLKVEVGPFEDSGKRQKLLEVLKSKGIKYSGRSNENSKYTRLSYEKVPGSKKIDDVTDVVEVADAMKELFDGTAELRKKLHEAIEEWKERP